MDNGHSLSMDNGYGLSMDNGHGNRKQLNIKKIELGGGAQDHVGVDPLRGDEDPLLHQDPALHQPRGGEAFTDGAQAQEWDRQIFHKKNI